MKYWKKYHIILFDQRGCGQSKPAPSIESNTLNHLIADIEVIRQHLNIKQWLVAGGSWGTTLAIAYGIKHAERVLAFVLRGRKQHQLLKCAQFFHLISRPVLL